MMTTFLFRRFLPPLVFAVPAVTFAQVTDVFDLTSMMYAILIGLGELFWVLAIMLFVWGVVKFIANTNDTAAHAQGKQFMVWGIIAFVVLLSLWAIVDLVLYGTFDIIPGGDIPYIDKDNSSL